MSDTEDKQSEYPEHWMWTPLGELGEWGSGGTPKSDNDAYYGGDIPWLKIGDLNNGLVSQSAEKITQKGLEESSAKLVPEDALLVAMYGSIGKLGITGFECTTNQAIAYCIPNTNSVSLKFLFWALQFYQTDLIESGKGGVQKNISQTVLKNFEIPLPPLTEQRRIVAKIEELFSNLDAGMDDLRAAEQQLERYRLSVLQAAVEGRLTADWRRTHDPEPADQLLERIEEERRRGWERDYRMRRYDIKGKSPPSGWKDRYDPPEKPDKAELGEIPDSWEWVVVDQLSPNIHYGYTESAQDEPVGPKFLRITDIQQDGQVNWKDAPYCEIGEQERKKYLLEPGDILFARTGGTVGKSCLIEDDAPEAVFASYLIRVITVDSIDERYVYLFFQTLDYWRQISEKKTGIGQPNVNATKLSELTLPLPPLAEQKRIVDEVERLLSVADDAEDTADREHTRAKRLRQSILKKAFSGQLVPHEEDASPPSIDGTASEGSDTGSSTDVDSDVEDLMGSADPSKQIEMDL